MTFGITFKKIANRHAQAQSPEIDVLTETHYSNETWRARLIMSCSCWFIFTVIVVGAVFGFLLFRAAYLSWVGVESRFLLSLITLCAVYSLAAPALMLRSLLHKKSSDKINVESAFHHA